MRCFTAGTAVLSADGSVAIEDIESGDLVVARAAGLGRWEAIEEAPAGYPQASDEVVRLGSSGPSERVGDLGRGVTFVFEDGVFQTDESGARIRRTGEVLAPVGDTMRRVAASRIDLEVRYDDGHVGTIEATPEHPFFVEGEGWVALGELVKGDVLAVEGGRTAVVVGLTEVDGGDVFNFEVLGLHNYHVDDGVIVHNACSRRLGRNLAAAGHVRPPGTAAHHIVAGGAPRAGPAQRILAGLGIDIDDAANGVFLPASGLSPNPTGAVVHGPLHTNAYYDFVNDMLANATTRQEAEAILDAIRRGLL